MTPLLKATRVGRMDNGKVRLADITLSLMQGEIIGILGVNGAGKSTTLSLLSGALAASSGAIQIMDEPLGHKNRAHIGLLPETPPLYPELTINENLDFAASLRGLSGTEKVAACEYVRRTCGLNQHANKLARHLSKGYRLRVGIAQAIIHRPKILLLDEPTAGLDPLQARDMRELISNISASCGIIIATHDLADIQTLCHRVIVLDAGKQVLEKSFTNAEATLARIQLSQPPATEALLSLDGIHSVERLEDGWFQLELKNPDNLLAQSIADKQWGLQAYIPEQDDFQALIYDMIDQGIAV